MKSIPLQARVKLNDYRVQIEGNKLFSARNRDESTTSFRTEVKAAEKKLHGKQAAKRSAKLKGKYTARKSAGRVKEYAPRRQKRGRLNEVHVTIL